MAKTNTEKIDELTQLTTTLNERVDTARRDVVNANERLQRIEDSLNALTTRVALAESQIVDLRKGTDEGGRRWWAIGMAFGGAIIGSLVTLFFRNAFPESPRKQESVKAEAPVHVKRKVPDAQ